MNSSATHTDPSIELRAEVERLKVENSLLRGVINSDRGRIEALQWEVMRLERELDRAQSLFFATDN